MLLILALLIVLVAIGGGIAINPLLFALILVAAVLALTSTRRGSAV